MLRFRVVSLWWRIARPRTVGVRALITDGEGRVLLVRHTYQRGWYLPGGGVKRGESLVQALRRELDEEVGVEPSGELRVLGAYSGFASGKSDHVVVFVVDAFERHAVRHREIAESAFYAPDALPDATSPGTRRRIDEYRGLRVVDFDW